MLKSIRTHVARATQACHSACRIVVAMTAGEAAALLLTTIHGDFVTGYLVLSAWVKDSLVRHHEKRLRREALRRSISIKGVQSHVA